MFLSVVIPIHNEEGILEKEITKLVPALDAVMNWRDY